MNGTAHPWVRQALAAAAALGLAAAVSGPAVAEDFTLIGHQVHQSVLTGAAGGDAAGEWAAENDAELNWLTFNVQDVHERLYREASLGATTVDVGFVADRYLRPQFAEMFEPLDDYLAQWPIEDFDEIPAGMLDGLTYDGKLYGIPMRHATAALHVNTAILEERGLAMPETFEDVLAVAREVPFTRDDGTRVYGLLLDYRSPVMIADIARALHNADFLTTDFELRANSPEMVEAVQIVADFFQDGVIPEAFLNFRTEDVITYMQQGRAAMSISPFSRYNNYNHPEQSAVAGQVVTVALPKSASLEGVEVAPVRTEYWSMVIPRHAQNKELSWDFIRNASSPENTIRAAINGNGPVRPSAYADERVSSGVVYAADEQAALRVARPTLPGFEQSARAEDIFIEEIDLVLLGMKSAQDAMDSVQARIEPLLPAR